MKASRKKQLRAFRLKRKMRKLQHNRCAICGRSFGSMRPTFEHVIPRRAGGTRAGNLVLTHLRCNQQRGHANPTGCLLIVLAAVNARLGR